MFLKTLVKKIGVPLISSTLLRTRLLPYCPKAWFAFRKNKDPKPQLPAYQVLDDSQDIHSFADIEMPENLKKKLLRIFPEATDIQRRTARVILEGQDLIGIAQTGSGKTLAYSLPILLKLATNPKPTTTISQGPRYLIICPTRQLAEQINDHVSLVAKQLNLKTGIVCGGSRKFQQILNIRDGVDVLIGTPGRVLDFLQTKFTLDRMEFLTVDEADRILEVGYEEQIKGIAEYAKDRPRQTTFFSATWSIKIKALVQSFLKPSAKYAQIGESQTTINCNITQIFEVTVSPNQKMDNTLYLIQENPQQKFIIFCNSKKSADAIEEAFGQYSIKICRLSGNLEQKIRNENLKKFKDGYARVMIATDVASRGLDIKNVTFVVNFETPTDVSIYIHRIGRTGRAGNKGVAVTYLDEDTPISFLKGLLTAMQENQLDIPKELAEFASERLRQEARANRMKKKEARSSNIVSILSQTAIEENKRKMEQYLKSDEWKQ